MMDTKLKDQINDADIPEIFRNYLLRNKHVGLFLDEPLLKEIEEIYVEYDSLFIFDEAEFCSYVITGIKKLDKHDYFYHYLKKVFETNLNLISKSKMPDYEKTAKLTENISKLQESEIPRILVDFYKTMNEFKESKDLRFLFTAYKISGVLHILFELYPENEYKSDFTAVYSTLRNLEV